MLLNSYALSLATIISEARKCYKEGGEDAVFNFLEEVASYDFSCPDKCSEWATDFYVEYKDEIHDYHRKSNFIKLFAEKHNLKVTDLKMSISLNGEDLIGFPEFKSKKD